MKSPHWWIKNVIIPDALGFYYASVAWFSVLGGCDTFCCEVTLPQAMHPSLIIPCVRFSLLCLL